MKRRIVTEEKGDCLKVKKAKPTFSSKPFDGVEFLSMLNDASSNGRPAFNYWLDAYAAYESDFQNVNPVFDFLSRTYNGEELVGWLNVVEAAFDVDSILSIVSRIVLSCLTSAHHRQKASAMFLNLLQFSNKLLGREPNCSTVQLLTAGCELNSKCADELIRQVNLDRLLQAQAFNNSTGSFELCVRLIVALLKNASCTALPVLHRRRSVLQTLLRRLVDVKYNKLVEEALVIFRAQFLLSNNVATVDKVQLVSKSTIKLCALFQRNRLSNAVQAFFQSYVDLLRSCDQSENVDNLAHDLYYNLKPYLDHSAANNVAVHLMRSFPKLIHQLLEEDCRRVKAAKLMTMCQFWQRIFADTCEVDVSSFVSVDEQSLAKLAMPQLAMEEIVFPLMRSAESAKILAGLGLVLVLVRRALKILDALSCTEATMRVLVDALPPFEEIRSCLHHCELKQVSAELLAFILILLHRCGYDLTKIDYLFVTTGVLFQLIPFDLKLELITLLSSLSNLHYTTLVSNEEEDNNQSLISCTLSLANEAKDDQQRRLVELAFCQLMNSNPVLRNRDVEMQMWFWHFATSSRSTVFLRDVLTTAFQKPYTLHEVVLKVRGQLKMANLQSVESIDSILSQWRSIIPRRCGFSVLVPVALWWYDANHKSVDKQLKYSIQSVLRCIFWIQSDDEFVALLRGVPSRLSTSMLREIEENTFKLRSIPERLLQLTLAIYDGGEVVNNALPTIEPWLAEPNLEYFLYVAYLWSRTVEEQRSTNLQVVNLLDLLLSKGLVEPQLFLHLDIVANGCWTSTLLHFERSVDLLISTDRVRSLVAQNTEAFLIGLLFSSKRLKTTALRYCQAFAPTIDYNVILSSLNTIHFGTKFNLKIYQSLWLELVRKSLESVNVAFQLVNSKCYQLLTDELCATEEKPPKLLSSLCAIFSALLDSGLFVRKNVDLEKVLASLLSSAHNCRSVVEGVLLKLCNLKNAKRLRLRVCQWLAEDWRTLADDCERLLPIARQVLSACQDDEQKVATDCIFKFYKHHLSIRPECTVELANLSAALSRHGVAVEQLEVADLINDADQLDADAMEVLIVHFLNDSSTAKRLLISCLENNVVRPAELKVVSRLAALWKKSDATEGLCQLILARRFESSAHWKLVHAMAESAKLEQVPLLSMVFGHSMFGSAFVVGTNLTLKMAIGQLLLNLCRVEQRSMKLGHIPCLLSAYNATTGELDRLILKILALYDSNGFGLSTFSPPLWGNAALTSFANWNKLGPTLWNRPSSSDVMSAIDEGRMKLTIDNFPSTISYDLNAACKDEAVYDPRFLLPLLAKLVAADSLLDCRQFITSRCLGFLLCGVSFVDKNLRALCYGSLSAFHDHLQSSAETFGEKAQVDCMLNVLRQSTLRDNERLAYLIGLFLSRLVDVIVRPESALFRELSYFMIIRPYMDTGRVPDFLRLFHSSDEYYNEERLWILNLIADGLKDSLDYAVVGRMFAFKYFCSLYTCSVCNEEQRRAIMRIMVATSRVPAAARSMCLGRNWIGWLSSVCDRANAWSVLEILVNIYRHVVHRSENRKRYAVALASCAYCALAKVDASTLDEQKTNSVLRLLLIAIDLTTLVDCNAPVLHVAFDAASKFEPALDKADVTRLCLRIGKLLTKLPVDALSSERVFEHYLSIVYRLRIRDDAVLSTLSSLVETYRPTNAYRDMSCKLRLVKRIVQSSN